jgi:hypothetical protein
VIVDIEAEYDFKRLVPKGRLIGLEVEPSSSIPIKNKRSPLAAGERKRLQ